MVEFFHVAEHCNYPSEIHLTGTGRMLVQVLLCLGIFLSPCLLFRWWNAPRKGKRRYPPSLPYLPLIGSLPFLRGFNNFPDFFMKKASELGPIFTFRTGSRLVLILNSKEVIEDALINHSSSFSGRSPLYTERVGNPTKKGLAMMNTSREWKKYHQLSVTILKQFGFGVKSTMESRISAEFEFLTGHLLKLRGQPFNPRELVYLTVTNVIMSFVFGRRHDYSLGLTEFGVQIKKIFDNFDLDLEVSSILRFLPFHRNKLRKQVEARDMIQNIIKVEIAKSLAEGADDCFVRRYVECVGEDLDDEQFSFTLRDIVAAGTDAASNSLLWTLVALTNHPDVQNRLRAEIDSVVPRDTLPSMNDQSKLPYVEATILEVMRWKTLVPLALPHITLTDTDIGDYFVPSETLVLVNLYAAHMDPKVWKDPEAFRPERFLDKDGQVTCKESVMPYSLGRRSCFGEVLARAELFLILTGLVQRFFIRPPEGQTSVPVKPVEPVALVSASSAFTLRFIARD